MPKSLTRSIMLENYGGKRFEKLEIMIESEMDESFEQLNEEVNKYLAEYIKTLPEQLALLDKAKKEQTIIPEKPLTKSIITPAQKVRHDKKLNIAAEAEKEQN